MKFLSEKEILSDDTSMVDLGILLLTKAGVPYFVLSNKNYRYKLDGNKLIIEQDISYHGSPCWDVYDERELTDAQVNVIALLTDKDFVNNLKVVNMEKELKSVRDKIKSLEAKKQALESEIRVRTIKQEV